MAIEEQDTKAKITGTALDLFANQGFHKTSISQIARQVGVSKSLIYNYFESKEDLLEHIVQDAIHRNLHQIQISSWDEVNTLDQLMEYMHNMILDLKTNSSYYRLLIMLTLQGTVKQKIMRDLMQQKGQFIAPLEHILQKHNVNEPEKMTYFFGALFDGLVLHFLYMEDDYPLDDLFEYFVTQFKILLQP